MKTLSKICRIAALVLAVASLVSFLFTFAVFSFANGQTVNAGGLQLAFGSELFEQTKVAKSADLLLCFFLTVLSVALTAFSLFKKSAALKYWTSGVSLGTAVYMFVIAVSNPWKFVDTRPFTDSLESIKYGPFVLYAAVAIILCAAFSIAYLLISDKIEVDASKGKKLTIPKRLVRFLKDYKSEIKKIVWPGFKDVIKNTVIVLIMCLLIGILVWVLDFGLGQLLSLIWG